MTLATALTRAQFGLDAPLVRVEVHCGAGLPQFSIVGLAETAVRESRDRVRAALAQGKFEFPPGRVTVNLAPADLPKEGGRYDLAIALGILAATGQLQAARLEGTEFYGELSLSGELRPVRGLLAASAHAARAGRQLIVPLANAEEARVAPGARVAGATTLTQVRNAFNGGTAFQFASGAGLPECPAAAPDLADVRGQAGAKRALEIAAAGSHSLLFVGPPGAGKSMLAQRLPGLLPALDADDALESAMLHSLVRPLPAVAEWRRPPFRAPHHGASATAVIGGGGRLRPGEITLAHCGVLFLDELPEYRRDVLEALREPLETGIVSPRARQLARPVSGAFPARRRHESVSLRLCGRHERPLPLHAAHRAPLRGADLGTPARSHRPARRRAAARIRGAFARGRGRGTECGRGSPGARRPGPPGRARRTERLPRRAPHWRSLRARPA